MNEVIELWSLPWHALQRSLANGFIAGTAAGELPDRPHSGAGVAATRASSWLVRARTAAPRAAATQASR